MAPLSIDGTVKVFKRKSTIQVVDLYDLKIDRKYQRDRNDGHVNKIKGDFNEYVPLYPVLSRRKEGGKWVWYIIDGQHIIAALKARNYTHAECECFEGLNPQQEADIFYKRSTTTRNIAGWVKLRSALAAGDIAAEAMLKIIRDAKLTTGLDVQDGRADVADFNTPRVLTEIYKKHREPAFRRLITILAKGWFVSVKDKHLQESARRTEMIRGLANFLNGNPAADNKIIAMLKSNPASKVLDEAVYRAGKCRKQRSQERFIVEVLTEALTNGVVGWEHLPSKAA